MDPPFGRHFPSSYLILAIKPFRKSVFHVTKDLGLVLYFHYRSFFGHAPTLTRINTFRFIPYSNRQGDSPLRRSLLSLFLYPSFPLMSLGGFSKPVSFSVPLSTARIL